MAKRKRKHQGNGGGAFGGKRRPDNLKPLPSVSFPPPPPSFSPPAPGPFAAEKERFFDLVQRELSKRNFASQKEADAFLAEHFTGRPMEELMADFAPDPDPHFDALDIIAGIESAKSPSEVKKIAAKALDVDPHCVQAHLALARIASSSESTRTHLDQAIEAGQTEAAADIAAVESGQCPSLWLMPRARPFLEAVEARAEFFWNLGLLDSCRADYEEILRLNPTDNQGVRSPLLTVLVLLDDLTAAQELLDRYPDDPSCAALYGRALVEFLQALAESPDFLPVPERANPFDGMKSPRLSQAKELLRHAFAKNPWGAAFLIDPRISEIEPLPSYRLHSPEEAVECARIASQAWCIPFAPAVWLLAEILTQKETPKVVQRLREEHDNFVLVLEAVADLNLIPANLPIARDEIETLVESTESIRSRLLERGAIRIRIRSRRPGGR